MGERKPMPRWWDMFNRIAGAAFFMFFYPAVTFLFVRQVMRYRLYEKGLFYLVAGAFFLWFFLWVLQTFIKRRRNLRRLRDSNPNQTLPDIQKGLADRYSRGQVKSSRLNTIFYYCMWIGLFASIALDWVMGEVLGYRGGVFLFLYLFFLLSLMVWPLLILEVTKRYRKAKARGQHTMP